MFGSDIETRDDEAIREIPALIDVGTSSGTKLDQASRNCKAYQ